MSTRHSQRLPSSSCPARDILDPTRFRGYAATSRLTITLRVCTLSPSHDTNASLRVQDARWRRGEAITAKAARSSLVGVEVLTEGHRAVNTYAGI